jgi:integrase
MPKPRKKEEIKCRFFRWLLGQRNGVYFADGRSNNPSLGRQSLGTKNKEEAENLIHDLDLKMAVKYGLADRSMIRTEPSQILDFQAGRELYEKYVNRPAVAGGPRKSTTKRYRAVLDKFQLFIQNSGLRYWNEVNRSILDSYASWLDGESYAYATEYLELNTIKQILKFFVQNDHLPAEILFQYPIRKPQGTDTYCWQPQEVQAMFDYCATDELSWLRHILIALASTGLRIGELASLRWSDIDLKKQIVSLTDESTRSRTLKRDRRTIKSGYSRSFPIHESLLTVLQEISRTQDGLVFHGPLGGKVKADTIRRFLIRNVLTPLSEGFPTEPDEIGFSDGRLHSFRHYFCSVCANSGVPEQILMKWLGHRNSKMVQRYYHLHDEESHRQMSRIEIIRSNGSDASVESE